MVLPLIFSRDQEDVVAIKHDSRDWSRESRRRNGRNHKPHQLKSLTNHRLVRYIDSDTARLRLKHGRPEKRHAPYSARDPSIGGMPAGAQVNTMQEEKNPASAISRHQGSNPKPIPGADEPKRPGAPGYSVSYTNTAKVTYSGASPQYNQNTADPSSGYQSGQRKIEDMSYDADEPNLMDYEKGPRQPSTTGTPGFSTYATAGPTRHDSRDTRSGDQQRRIYDWNRAYESSR